MPQPLDDHDPSALRIEVERTGGIAGIRRIWRVDPTEGERETWHDLIGRCPWQDAPPPATAPVGATAPAGADRFQWTIVVMEAGGRRAVELAGDLDGPWRGLVDAVRAGHAAAPSEPPA